jgi:tetratricopeptide (TPR) repeat protein
MAAERITDQAAREVEQKMNAPLLEGARPSPEKVRQQNDRAFEPGPDSSAGPQQPYSPTAMRSRTGAPPGGGMMAKPFSSKSNRLAKKSKMSSNLDMNRFYQKALACHRGGRLTEAALFYRNVLKIDANHKEAMLNLAAVYIEAGHFNQAHPLLKRLEKTTPRPEGVLLNLAITALGNDTPETALSYLDQAEAADDSPFFQIQFHRAVALARVNRFSEALVLYKQVEAKRPDDYRVKFNLAVTYDALEDYPRALQYYEKLLQTPAPASQSDRQSIIRRADMLRRYLNSTQPQRQ